MSESALIARGPVGKFRFPKYYTDVNGTSLVLMTDPNDLLTVANAAELPDPTQPVSLTNFFGESFYYSCGSTIDLPNGGTALLVAAIEGVYATADESVEDGKQFVFSRLRWRIDTSVGGMYTIEHPWGTKVFENVGVGNRAINHTEDALHLPNAQVTVSPNAVDVHDPKAWYDTPLDPSLAQIDTFCGWDNDDAPEGYIGNPQVPHTITGSAKGFSHFKIKGPNNAFGVGVNEVSTALFNIAGKKLGIEAIEAYAQSSTASTLDFDIVGTSTPRTTLVVTNADGAIIVEGVATNEGQWQIRQSFEADSPLYPKDGHVLTVTAGTGETVTFTFLEGGPDGSQELTSGTLTVTGFGTTVPLQNPPPPVPGTANFVGELQHLGGLSVAFPAVPPVANQPLVFSIANVPRALFVNTGLAFGTPIVAGEALAVDRFKLRLDDNLGQLVDQYSAQMVAQEDTSDPLNTTVRQDVVQVEWTIPADRFSILNQLNPNHIQLFLATPGAAKLTEADIQGTFADVTTLVFTNIIDLLGPIISQSFPLLVPVVTPLAGGAGPNGQTGYLATAAIEWITLVEPSDPFSAGTITLVTKEKIVVPRNLIMALPANWLTLQQFVDQAPDDEKAGGVGYGHVATIFGNRQSNGIVIAGDISIHKDDQEKAGIVTFINRVEGYFRINGNGNDSGGTLVRLNDPEGVHSIQTGRGIIEPNTVNGSPDPRYTNDPTNYTFNGTTGYPFGLNGTDANGDVVLNPSNTDNLPDSNAVNEQGVPRTGGESGTAMMPRKFEPLLVGDYVTSTGSMETVGGVRFQSAHSVLVGVSIATPLNDIDYTFVEEAEWDVAGWENLRLKGFFILPTSSNENVSVFRLGHNGAANANVVADTVHQVDDAGDFPQFIAGTAAMDALGGNTLANTIINDAAGNAVPGIGQVTKLRYDWDFIIGESSVFKNPEAVVREAGDPAGLLQETPVPDLNPNATVADNAFRVFSPVTREIVGKTSTRLTAEEEFANNPLLNNNPDELVIDVRGNFAQWGKYLSPNGIGHPEMGEIDLSRFNSPFLFQGLPWNLDRRLGPAGGDEPIPPVADSTDPSRLGSLGLDPFPSSGFHLDRSFVPSQVSDTDQPFRPPNIHSIVTSDIITGRSLDHLDPPNSGSAQAAAGAAAVITAAPSPSPADILVAEQTRAQQDLDNEAAIAAFQAANPVVAPPVVVTVLEGGAGAEGQSGTGVGITGTIEEIKLMDQNDRFSAGTIMVSGETIVIPQNLIIALPANWLTLQEFCAQAPVSEQNSGIGIGHITTILANRQSNGILVAGDVSIHKDNQEVGGVVTWIDSNEGYFRINGDGTNFGGTMVRINDPDGVHSVQSGPGVANPALNNGSPDVRYTNDPTNYTVCGTTGYPFGINGNFLPPVNSGRNPGESGIATNTTPIQFEPLLVGDFISVAGGMETVDGVTFISAHTALVGSSIATTATTPVDFVLVEEAEWDVANWANLRLKGLNIGPMSSNQDLVVYRLAHNGASDANTLADATHQVDDDGNLPQFIHGTVAADALGATTKANTVVNDLAGNPVPDNGQVVKVLYDFDFIIGESKPFKNPAAVVAEAGDPSGLLTDISDPNNAFLVFSPIAREIVYRTALREAAEAAFANDPSLTDPNEFVIDVQGNFAQWGFYVSPNGVGHPEMGEIDLAKFSQPHVFEGQLWNLDRRLGPVGGSEAIATNPLGTFPLDPFPLSGLPIDAGSDANQLNRPTNIDVKTLTDPVTDTLLSLTTGQTAADDASAGAADVLSNSLSVNFNTNRGGFILDRLVNTTTFGVTTAVLPISSDLLPLDITDVEVLAGEIDLLRQDYVIFQVEVSGATQGLGDIFLRSVDARTTGGLVELQAQGVGYFRLGSDAQDGSGTTDTYTGTLVSNANVGRRSGFSFVRNGGGAGLSGLSLPLVVTYPRFTLPGQFRPNFFGPGISVFYITPFGFNFLQFVLSNISTSLP